MFGSVPSTKSYCADHFPPFQRRKGACWARCMRPIRASLAKPVPERRASLLGAVGSGRCMAGAKGAKRKHENGKTETELETKAKKSASASRLTLEKAKAFFEEHGIKVHLPAGKDVDITPLAGFQCDGFAKRLTKYCQKKFEKPTPIQACTWPLIMQKSDVCGIAKTGSGKTLAFAMPYLSMSRLGELDVFEQPCASPREQRQAITETGVDMAICTPGRLQESRQSEKRMLNDLVEESTLDLSYVQYLVLDEADRMLDMGFIDSVKALISKMPKAGKRQTCMFSATWPATVHALATKFLSEPVHVGIGSVDEGVVANTAIRQIVEVIKNEKDCTRLHWCLWCLWCLPTVVSYDAFAGKANPLAVLPQKALQSRQEGDHLRIEIAWLETFLWEKGYEKVIALQGDMSQDKRTQALADFKATRKTLGRTQTEMRSRAGKKGLAICFFCPDSKGAQDEKAHAGDLCAILRKANQEVPKDTDTIEAIHVSLKCQV
eukprot:g916.t1